jgi:hypothetical protein
MVKPTPDSISYVIGQFNGLTANFPLAPFTKAYDDFKIMATGTQALAPGNISVPVFSSTTHQYISKNFNLASSTTITSYGFQKFRRFESILIWFVLLVIPTLFILWRLIMPI